MLRSDASLLNGRVPADALTVDPLLSYARGDGDAIKVVLVLPAAGIKRRHVWLRLQGADGGVGARADVTRSETGQRVEASIPRSGLPDGIWRLKLRVGPNGPPRSLRTRLVVNDRQPVALLPKFTADVVGS